ncbi:hypothetical protein DLAC_10613 [Tieghemostelium lacteum]|uniref:EGF-like domain-containing protein n=1 Tax=Tieghemostelium lacteum TaxID=361077 RepID=A0A151Z4T6_TIELA|nr:hypothetical protein DLAC_10613 [Tieghemostelium lacteum]|eukprot:KYQ88814.1 hypothetical protein DLAC_10613 [Tieghemostelium lacteum]
MYPVQSQIFGAVSELKFYTFTQQLISSMTRGEFNMNSDYSGDQYFCIQSGSGITPYSTTNLAASNIAIAATPQVSSTTSPSITSNNITGLMCSGYYAFVLTTTQLVSVPLLGGTSVSTVSLGTNSPQINMFIRNVFYNTTSAYVYTTFSATKVLTLNKAIWVVNTNSFGATTPFTPNPPITSDIAFFYNEPSGKIIFGAGSNVYSYKPSDNTFETYTGTGTVYAAAINSFYIYACYSINSEIKLVVLNYLAGPVTFVNSYTITNDSSSCLSANYNHQLGQLFFSLLKTSNNQLGISTIGTDGGNPQVSYISNQIVTPASVNAFSYPIGYQGQTLYIATPTATVLQMSYQNLCPNQCSGNGNCFKSRCTCTGDYVGKDCSHLQPVITSTTTIPYYQSTNTITLTGTNFVNDTFTLTIQGVQCANTSFINSTTLTCNLPPNSVSSWAPLVAKSVSIAYPSWQWTNQNFAPQLFTFTRPVIDSYAQSANTIVLQGHNFFSPSYISTQLGTTSLSCSNTDTTSTCTISGNVASRTSTLKVYSSPMQTNTWLDGSITLNPYITSFQPLKIPTDGSVPVTIYGIAFKTSGTETFNIIQGTTNIEPIANNVAANSIIFSPSSGISSTKTFKLQITTSGTTYTSNSITFQYLPPSIVSISQLTPTNKFSISGNNFGTSTSLVQASIGSTSVTVSNVNNHGLVITLPNDVRKNDLTMTVDGQSLDSSYPFNLPPLITSISPLPSIDGGITTIFGEYLVSTIISIGGTPMDCSYPGSTNYPSTATCNFPSGTGEFTVTALSQYSTSNDLSDTFDSNYHQPTVSSITPNVYKFNENESTIFTITGENFADESLDVQINNEPCTVTSINSTQIICEYSNDVDPQTVVNPVVIKITVDSVVGNNNLLLIFEKSCPNTCTPNGQCNISSGQCTCTPPYSGTDCTTIDPTDSSSNSSLDSNNPDNISISSTLYTNIALTILSYCILLLL